MKHALFTNFLQRLPAYLGWNKHYPVGGLPVFIFCQVALVKYE